MLVAECLTDYYRTGELVIYDYLSENNDPFEHFIKEFAITETDMLRVLKDQKSIQNPEHELYQDWIRDENHKKCLSHVQTVYTFLEQTSWNNFNEGGNLQSPVEDYARKFGCYPNAVLADRTLSNQKQ